MSIQLSELKKQKLFAALNENELKQICDAGTLQKYSSGERLIREGSINHFLFLIANGAVHIKSYGVKVAKLSAGSLIGEVSAAGLGAPIADVAASGSVSAFKIPFDIINSIASRNPEFAKSLHEEAMSRVLG